MSDGSSLDAALAAKIEAGIEDQVPALIDDTTLTPGTPLDGSVSARVAPHLVTVALGTNDKLGASQAVRTTAEFKARMHTIIADYLTASDVIITTPLNSALDFAGYRAALYELADEFDIPLFDAGDRLGTATQAALLMADAYHANKAGNLVVASGMTPLIAPV